MLTAAKLSGTVHSYYSADDYYSQGQGTANESSNSSTNKDPNNPGEDHALNDNDLSDQEAAKQNPQKAPSFWYGKTAKDFNLSGEIDGKTIDNLTQGLLPNGGLMKGKKNENGERIFDPGRDLTFSAPKSVSILSEILGATDIRNIHQESVKQTLDHIEENYSLTRVKVNGKIIKQLTKNLLFGAYEHNTSRALDPNLHTHCITLNVTKRGDGTYKTVFFDKIFDDYKHLGLIYRSNLAYNLQKQGYQVEITNQEHGFFEIKSFPKTLIEKFSSRRKAIEEQMDKVGMGSAKAKQIAALLTRDKKIDVANNILKEQWNETLKEELHKLDKTIDTKDIDLKNLDKTFRTSLSKSWKDVVKENFPKILQDKTKSTLSKVDVAPDNNNLSQNLKPEDIARTEVQSAINHLDERNSIFTHKELISQSLKITLGSLTLTHITNAIESLIKDNLLVSCAKLGYENHLASKSLLDAELKVIEFTKDSLNPQNHKSAIYNNKDLDTTLTNHPDLNTKYQNLKLGQKDALNLILTSKNPIVAIQGYAGTGKTHTLGIVKELAKLKDHSFLGLAPTGNAVKELQGVGIKSTTLQDFLIKYKGYAEGRGTLEGIEKEKEEKFKNKTLIIDESSMISSVQMQRFLTITQKLDLKTIFIGDYKQLNAVGAGKPFYQMLKTKVKAVVMGDIVRQKNLQLKGAVYDVINASSKKNTQKDLIKQAFSKINDIHEIKLDDKQKEKTKETLNSKSLNNTRLVPKDNLEKAKNQVKLVNKIAKETAKKYCELSPEQKDNTVLLTLSNETRIRVNTNIRNILKKEGKLTDSFNKETLANRNLTQEAQKNINSYKKGDIIRFNQNYRENKIDKGNYYQITSINLKTQELSLTQLQENKDHNNNQDNSKSILSKIGELFTKTHQTFTWNPSKIGQKSGSVEIYHLTKKEFCIGDKINFTRGFAKQDIYNSLAGNITNITNEEISIQTTKKDAEGKNKIMTLTKDNHALKHMDYAYAFTAHRAQGSTYDNVIAVLESYNSALTNQKSFYVEISRARYNVTLILDDKNKIIKKLEKDTGEKLSILDALKKGKKIEAKNKDVSKINNNSPIKEKQYIIQDFSSHELQERFKEGVRDNLIHSNLKGLDEAMAQAFNKVGSKIYFGDKKKLEVKWHGEAGYVKDWKLDQFHSWGTKNIKLTKEEKERFKDNKISQAEFNKRQQALELKIQKTKEHKTLDQQKAAIKAQKDYSNYKETNRIKGQNHPYLQKKNIEEFFKLKDIKFTNDNKLVIPVRNIKGEIQNLQKIDKDGTKLFEKNGQKIGNFYLMGQSKLDDKNNKDLYIAEGFATAASIYKATKSPVAICFDAGNIDPVLKQLKEHYPDKNHIIAADDDKWGINKDGTKAKNTGRIAAIDAAKKYGATAIIPEFSKSEIEKFKHDVKLSRSPNDNKLIKGPTDFNDLHQLRGINAVTQQLKTNSYLKSYTSSNNLTHKTPTIDHSHEHSK